MNRRYAARIAVALMWLSLTLVIFQHGGDLTSYAQASTVEVLGFTVLFEGVTYDSETDQSKWMYRVKPTFNADKDLSFWTIQLCLSDGHSVTDYSHPDSVKIGTDPHTGITGIKYNFKVDKFVGDELFWFTLQGDWETTDVDVGGKAGLPVEYGLSIRGPSCKPIECVIHYNTKSGKTDLRLLRPGVYATRISEIELSGKGGARISFQGFQDATYLEDPSGPSIRFSFGIGQILGEVESAGWLSVDQLNEYEAVFDQSEVEGGMTIRLWMRTDLGDHHFSSDYEGGGQVSITPVCS